MSLMCPYFHVCVDTAKVYILPLISLDSFNLLVLRGRITLVFIEKHQFFDNLVAVCVWILV